jgi:hypothetical protein
MAPVAASALSIGQVDALRKEKGQVIRKVPMTVIAVRQLQHICKTVSTRVVRIDFDGLTAETSKRIPFVR